MTRLFRITDGTTTVSFLESGDGFVATAGGFGSSRMDSANDDLPVQLMRFVESYSLNLRGSDQDDIADRIRDLRKLARKAKLFRRKKFQTTPVYLEQQARNETNIRRAIVYRMPEFEHGDPFWAPFDFQALLENLAFTIVRGIWVAGTPGTLPSAMTLSPTWDAYAVERADFDSVSESGSSTISDLFEEGKAKVAVYMDGSLNTAYGQISGLSSAKRVVVNFRLDPNSIAIGSNVFTLFASASEFALQIRENPTGSYEVYAYANPDVTGSYLTSWYDILDGENEILIDWKASSGAGNDDGYLKLWIDGVLKETVSNIDNDTKSSSDLDFGIRTSPPAGSGDVTFYIYDIRYAIERDAVPTRVHIANYHSMNKLYPDVIYEQDASAGPGFTGLTLGDRMFPATPAQDDRFRVQMDGEFPKAFIIPKLSTAGAFTTSDLVLHIWTGTWTALTLGDDYLIYPGPDLEAALSQADEDIQIVFGAAISSATVFSGDFVFAISETNATPSWGTVPVLSESEFPYALHRDYFEIPEDSLLGDRPGFVNLRFRHPYGGDASPDWGSTSRILLGAKRTGLEKFVARVNMGNAGNPTEWTVSAGTDGSFTADPTQPGGKRLEVDFAGDVTNIVRATATGDGLLRYYAPGTYRVFATLYQNGGSAGDCEVQLRTRINSTSDGDPLRESDQVSTAVADSWHIVELQEISLPFGTAASADELGVDLIFEILMERNTGSAELYMGELILFPVDLWAASLNDPKADLLTGASALRGDTALDLDGGILLPRTAKYLIDASLGLVFPEEWNREGGPPPEIEVDAKVRIYVLILHFEDNNGDGTWYVAPMSSSPGKTLSVEVYQFPVYEFLRGDE